MDFKGAAEQAGKHNIDFDTAYKVDRVNIPVAD